VAEAAAGKEKKRLGKEMVGRYEPVGKISPESRSSME
jgi:hypothetical protein